MEKRKLKPGRRTHFPSQKQNSRLTTDGYTNRLAKEVTLKKLKFMDGTDGREKRRDNVGH